MTFVNARNLLCHMRKWLLAISKDNTLLLLISLLCIYLSYLSFHPGAPCIENVASSCDLPWKSWPRCWRTSPDYWVPKLCLCLWHFHSLVTRSFGCLGTPTTSRRKAQTTSLTSVFESILSFDSLRVHLEIVPHGLGGLSLKENLTDFDFCVFSQAHCRADLLHGGVEGTCEEVWSRHAEVLRAVPVRLWRRGAQWACTGEAVAQHFLSTNTATFRKIYKLLFVALRWDGDHALLTWTLVTLWIIHSSNLFQIWFAKYFIYTIKMYIWFAFNLLHH